MKDNLDDHGSACIRQIGGLGKTQLLIAFAEWAEKMGLIPGSCFWVSAHGSTSDVLRSVADFVESLLVKKLSAKNRTEKRFLLSALRLGLSSRKGRWLICLDNADEPEINGIMGDLCKTVNSISPCPFANRNYTSIENDPLSKLYFISLVSSIF